MIQAVMAKVAPSWCVQEYLLLVVLPFSYGAATRVPFVFAGLHCRSLGLSTPYISAVLGCYQVARVAGNRMVKRLGPQTSLIAGAACGVLGYIVLAHSQQGPAQPHSSSIAQVSWLAASFVLVGLSEQITALQIFCKQRYEGSAESVRTTLLQQYACNVCGTAAAFLSSGLAYSSAGLPLAAAVGGMFESVLLLGSVWFCLVADPAGSNRCYVTVPASHVPATLNPHGKQHSATCRHRPPANTDSAAVKAVRAQEQHIPATVSDPPSWISMVVAVTFAVQALLIGTVLSTAPLLVADTMGFGAWHVGVTFAAGEALGSCALLASSTPQGQAAVRRILPMPLCLLATLAVMSSLALLLPFVTAHHALALACLALVMGLNDVGTSMSGECQGATLPERHYRSINVVGNTLRRVGNTATCVTGPLLYQLHPALPFALFGSLTLLWTCALSALFAQRARECGAEDITSIACRSPWSAAVLTASGIADGGPDRMHLDGLQRYLQVSFVSQERRFWAQAESQQQQQQQQQQQEAAACSAGVVDRCKQQ